MAKEMHHPFLIGEKCYLRGLEESDLCGNYFQWFNDQEVTKCMRHGAFPNSETRMREFYEKVTRSENDMVLAIICRKDGVHIGNIGLHNINWLYRCAELGIIIGEKHYYNKGIGTEAIKLVLRHAFLRLNLHKIYLITDENNKGAIKAFEKSGFKKEGLLREDCFRNGKYTDSVYMGCLGDDFQKATTNPKK